MTSDASAFWDREVHELRLVTWMAHPQFRFYINERVSGSIHQWPFDWFVASLKGRRFRRALSIGCGTGTMERHLIRLDVCDRVDALDASLGSLAVARQEAKRAGYASRIHYFASDFNNPVLPKNRYDLVICHESLHHVLRLEKLYDALLRAMTRDAVMYIEEYIGPSRFEWTDELIAPQRAVFETVGARVRDTLSYPIEIEDPSEAVRSSAIVPLLRQGFEVVHDRPYGGGLLALLAPHIDWDRAEEDLPQRLIEIDRNMPPYCTVMVAKPKRGLARLLGHARYSIVPKLQRILRELRG